jgi:histidyl-tRNA synthetase
MEMRAPKGVFDIYPAAKERWQDSAYWSYIEALLRKHASNFNFKEIRTPMFEHLELFLKGVGEGSDIVSKEMYQFTDKGGRELALRPEGTAAAIRAYLENKLYAQDRHSKLFYIAPMFRYERQQSGRYRQHHQFGAEVIGVSSPFQDVEIIDMAFNLYKSLGIKNLKLLINCVGGSETRKLYCEALKTFLEPKYEMLSADSKNRFSKNILRILDSKDPSDQQLLEGCPDILDYLDDQRKQHFQTVLQSLSELGIEYQIEPKLVRGLDYYDSTVFEILTSTDNKNSLTIGGGGRYDGLIESYGHTRMPAVGFGTGIERIIQTLLSQNSDFQVPAFLNAFILPLDDKYLETAYMLAHELRKHNISCDIDLLGKKLKNALPYASSQGAQFAIMIGEEEAITKNYKVKNLQTRQELNMDKGSLINFLLNPNP